MLEKGPRGVIREALLIRFWKSEFFSIPIQKLLEIVLLICLLNVCSQILCSSLAVHELLKSGVAYRPYSGVYIRVIDFAGSGIYIRVVVEILNNLIEAGEVNVINLGQSAECIVLSHIRSELRSGYVLAEIDACCKLVRIICNLGVDCHGIAKSDVLGVRILSSICRLRKNCESKIVVSILIICLQSSSDVRLIPVAADECRIIASDEVLTSILVGYAVEVAVEDSALEDVLCELQCSYKGVIRESSLAVAIDDVLEPFLAGVAITKRTQEIRVCLPLTAVAKCDGSVKAVCLEILVCLLDIIPIVREGIKAGILPCRLVINNNGAGTAGQNRKSVNLIAIPVMK